MNRQDRKFEVMAPAGNWEAMSAAIKAGADSVYFGIEQLNMRARQSNNFTAEDLPEIVRICSEKGVRTYITLNTIIYDHDLTLMRKIVDTAKAANITAIIASDLAVMNYCKKVGLELHISTQSNVTNIETVEMFSNYADVIVLSRELTLKQVRSIYDEIIRRDLRGPSGELVQLEMFAHGALCMAVSGKCYLSLHSNNASANRGACIQNCRKTYVVTDKEDGNELEIDNEYIMSAKDLCTINFLDQILDAGVHVLKIEGRGRAADYVYTATNCYREAVDAYSDNTYSQEKIDVWMQRLSTVYNRGFWDGYYLGKQIGEWSDSYGSQATTKKVYIGKGMKYFDKVQVGEFKVESQSFKKGDKLIITGPTTGYVELIADEIRHDDGTSLEKAERGQTITLPVTEKVRPSDRLYKIVEVEA